MKLPRATNPHSLYGGVIDAGRIASNAATTVKFQDNAVTIPKVESALKSDVINISLSFESAGELGTFKIYFPMRVIVNKIRTVVTKVIGASTPAYVTVRNVSGLAGIVTIDAGAAIGEEDSAAITDNNVIAKDSWLSLTTSKGSSYAGTVEVFIEYTITT
ncbi:MAG: hypothetical protein A4E48_00226 [Methanosaeta sp. PtaU1.Bin060]|nr:MAG: hypothetical protein A4E48_00226 [Methanosaeta sp. PtaU1.Bin060]